MDVSAVTTAGVISRQASAVSSDVVAERRQVAQAARSVNESGVLGRNQIVFAVDSQTHRPITRIEDPDTHEVLLQIPPEYVLQLAQDLKGGGASETYSDSANT